MSWADGSASGRLGSPPAYPPKRQQDWQSWLFLEPSLSSNATVSGNGWMRCTGPFAMSAVVWPPPARGRNARPLLHEVKNHLVVAACSRTMERPVVVVIPRVDVRPELFDQVLQRRHPRIRHMLVRVAGVALTVPHV